MIISSILFTCKKRAWNQKEMLMWWTLKVHKIVLWEAAQRDCTIKHIYFVQKTHNKHTRYVRLHSAQIVHPRSLKKQISTPRTFLFTNFVILHFTDLSLPQSLINCECFKHFSCVTFGPWLTHNVHLVAVY